MLALKQSILESLTLNLISSFRTKKACLIFFDEIDAVGGARFDDGAGGDNEVKKKDERKKIQVELLETNRFET